MLPFWVAAEQGLFRRHGLDVTLVNLPPSTATQALQSGSVPVAATGGSTVTAYVGGATDLVYVAGVSNKAPYRVVARPEITRMEDLRGKAIAVTRAGTVTDFGARTALLRYGLRPELDVGMVQAGGVVESLATVQSGNAAAALMSPPFDVAARKQGLHELLDLPSLGVEFLMNGLAVQREYLAPNEAVLLRFMRGYLEGLARLKRDRAFTKQVLGKYTGTEDDEALESAYEAFGQRYFARVPYPTVGQLQTVIDFVAEREPSARDLRPESLFDDRFVRALDQEGFVDRLYR
jgi:ABC-type nitrate/sulfonate/bicarbonate transport system substrate-binding protein